VNRWKRIGSEEVSRKAPKRSQFALALAYEWFAVRTRNGEIELGNEANLDITDKIERVFILIRRS